MRGISMRENREARRSPVGADAVSPSWAGWQVGTRAGREGKASGRKPSMNGRRESDSRIVPAKLANNAGDRRRSRWREGGWTRGTRTSKTRPGRRAGTMTRQMRWIVR
jgi:hypothetical protein